MDNIRDIVFVPITMEMITHWANPNPGSIINCVPLTLYFLGFMDFATYVELEERIARRAGPGLFMEEYNHVLQILEDRGHIPTDRVASGVVSLTEFSDNELLYSRMQSNTACAINIARSDGTNHTCVLAKIDEEFYMLDPQSHEFVRGLPQIHAYFQRQGVTNEWIITRRFEQANPEKRRRISGGKTKRKNRPKNRK